MAKLTLTMAAPNASVEDPAKDATMRAPRREPKDLDVAAHMLKTHRMAEATMKTGLLPKYTAVGTQKKFYYCLDNPPYKRVSLTPSPNTRIAQVSSPVVVAIGF